MLSARSGLLGMIFERSVPSGSWHYYWAQWALNKCPSWKEGLEPKLAGKFIELIELWTNVVRKKKAWNLNSQVNLLSSLSFELMSFVKRGIRTWKLELAGFKVARTLSWTGWKSLPLKFSALTWKLGSDFGASAWSGSDFGAWTLNKLWRCFLSDLKLLSQWELLFSWQILRKRNCQH